MESRMTENGISVCPTGEERYEFFNASARPRRAARFCQYDYRHTDGRLFSCVATTLERCREKRDYWLENGEL